MGNVAEYNVFVLVSTRERKEEEEEIKKKEGGLRNTRGPGNRKRQEVGRCQPKQRKTAKRDGDTNLQAWDRLVYTSIVRRSVRRGFNQEISGTR